MKQTSLHIPASKSISNRLLILQYLYPELEIFNLSTAKDTVVLQEALKQLQTAQNGKNISINIGHAGTAMRFLTALTASLENKTVLLDGSERMRQRPVKILVDALRKLGADIGYLQQEGFPPLLIKGKKLQKSSVEIDAQVSSQYITALLLIAPRLADGINLRLTGKMVSLPYIQMTLNILQQLGIETEWQGNNIRVVPANKLKSQTFSVEGDWSSASYFYGALALLRNQKLILQNFDENSLQGDKKIAGYFTEMGIQTDFLPGHKIRLTPVENFSKPEFLTFDLLETPDLAQTLAVTCLGLGIRCRLSGLQTLRIKETDRLSALQNEMQKLGALVHITHDSLEITKPLITQTNIEIATYDDHRMAMSFAILQKKYPSIQVAHPDVVVKSFPEFWELFGAV